jgi:putative ABC transport system substrate-binding protein
MRRREFIAAFGGAAAGSLRWPRIARAQQAPIRPLVGVLSPVSQAGATRNIDALRKELRDLGYIEGRNIVLEFRYADGNVGRMPQIAAELVALRPDVILAFSASAILAVHAVTKTIPLVMGTLEDPVALGLVKSIARPGTNVTGTWLAGDEGLVGKRLALLKDMVPGLTRLGAVVNPDDATDAIALRLLPAVVRALGLELHVVEARDGSAIDAAFRKAAGDGVQALFVSQSPLFNTNRREVAAIADRLRLPTTYGFREFAEAGGLMSYGPSVPEMYRRSAGLVAKILKGASPADLPVEIPTRFELVVNLKAAKQLGLTISDQFMLLADEVIE